MYKIDRKIEGADKIFPKKKWVWKTMEFSVVMTTAEHVTIEAKNIGVKPGSVNVVTNYILKLFSMRRKSEAEKKTTEAKCKIDKSAVVKMCQQVVAVYEKKTVLNNEMRRLLTSQKEINNSMEMIHNSLLELENLTCVLQNGINTVALI